MNKGTNYGKYSYGSRKLETRNVSQSDAGAGEKGPLRFAELLVVRPKFIIVENIIEWALRSLLQPPDQGLRLCSTARPESEAPELIGPAQETTPIVVPPIGPKSGKDMPDRAITTAAFSADRFVPITLLLFRFN